MMKVSLQENMKAIYIKSSNWVYNKRMQSNQPTDYIQSVNVRATSSQMYEALNCLLSPMRTLKEIC